MVRKEILAIFEGSNISETIKATPTKIVCVCVPSFHDMQTHLCQCIV